MGSWIAGPYTTEPGPRRRWGKLVIHAEDGFIYCQWDDGTKDVLELPDARSRVTEISKELAVWEDKKDHGGPGIDSAFAREMYYELRGNLQNLVECIKDAERQGDPTDPKVRYDKVKAFLLSKRAGFGDSRTTANAIATQLVMPVTYSRLPDFVPTPKKGFLEFKEGPPLPPR